MRREEFASAGRALVEGRLRTLLAGDGRSALRQAMAEATLSGGRRIRATLVLLASAAVGGRPDDALPLACAIEMIHAASLALDDLPAMDDDRERRNAPALHCRHGEGVAILTAIALLARAFEIAGDHDRAHGTGTVARLAQAIGEAGMCGGQLADLAARRGGGPSAPTAAGLEDLYRAKTGRLMGVACEIGAMAGGGDPAAHPALAAYGMQLGIAYQIADDVADRTSDAADGSANYAILLGAPAARARALALLDDAYRATVSAGVDAAALHRFARGLLDDRLAELPQTG